MDSYQLEITLDSETIFGSGHSMPGLVDIEIEKDSRSFPYLKGKTIKGKLREQAMLLNQLYKTKDGQPLDKVLSRLFGLEGYEQGAILAFSDARLPVKVEQELKHGLEIGLFTENELFSGLTEIRSMTSINEEGTAAHGSLRSARVLRKGLRFEAELTFREEAEKLELSLLALAATMLQQLGTMQNRGKGAVRCRLLKDGVDLSQQMADEFIREVSAQ